MTNTPEFEFIPTKMVEVDHHQDGQRLDNFLMAQYRVLPKARIYQMIRKGEVRINGGRAKPISRLKAGDMVRLPPVKIEKKVEIEIPEKAWKSLQTSIVFENNEFLVIDKPSGLAVHAGSEIPYGIIEILKRFGDNDFYELVQRLDRDTSGLLLIAKTGKSLRTLQQSDLSRQYALIVEGNWKNHFKEITSIITLPLDTENRVNGERHVTVSESGKEAETHFTLINAGKNASHLQAVLKTGRTHQIRVHSSASGFPIVGDPRYNSDSKMTGIDRLYLHAERLSFILEDQAYKFESPIPKGFLSLLNHLN